MLNQIVLLLALFAISSGNASAQTDFFHNDSLVSLSLKETRKIQVLLPKDYDATLNDTYDVLYMLDGEWYTKLLPDAYGFAKSAGFAPNTILVLIPNTYIGGVNQRNRDFEPFIKENSAGYDSFLSFLQKELFQFVDRKYPNNGSRSLLGSSLGGLFTIYAFLTAPDTFQAYLTCDPNLDWNDAYVTKLAIKKLPGLKSKKTVLFIATNDYSFKANGGYYFKEALKTKAAGSIKWQVKTYKNETHYSLQYKAFYDAIRFSYAGFSPEKFDVIPQKAVVQPGKPLRLYITNKNPAVRFTLDGKEPDEKSGRLSPDNPIVISNPTTLKIKNLATRQQYERSMNLFFNRTGLGNDIQPAKIADTLSMHYISKGVWKELPPLKDIDPATSLQKDYSDSTTSQSTSKIYLIKKTLQVHQDGYFIFAVDAPDGSRVLIQKTLLIDNAKSPKSGMKSFALYLKPGYYTVNVQLFQKETSKKPEFRLFKTTESSDRWWENDIML
ncbi:alpha/beta hydrolase-fold protein [Dyadobacter sp. CY356]|uniref:alpha/beta hydrolase-fold protein n=1 Tax=Dyadobacter sp. CY356 TaxID=2906442 RepID=UPI001EEBA1ED|nr:alpha/beta hydrolase-fold protein [Dyadobacter sp. CY356]MCF0055128.1 hypothetical protein [Dyadobacter sp. CY356]